MDAGVAVDGYMNVSHVTCIATLPKMLPDGVIEAAKPSQTDREREATVMAAQICERSVEANREALRNIPDEEINCAIRSYHLNAIRIAETCAEQILASLPDLAAARAETERRAKLELLNRYYDMTRDELIAAVFLDRDHILREAVNSRPAKPTPGENA